MRCKTGECCTRLALPLNPDSLQKAAAANPDHKEIVQIARMLKPVGFVPSTGFTVYSCKNVLLNGNCAIYEDRPTMCRNYPNGKECPFESCTYKARKKACS